MAASSYRKISPKRNFFYSAVIVLITHGLVILFFANLKHSKPSPFSPSLKMIQLKSAVVESILVVEMPVINVQPHLNQPAVPVIDFDKVDDASIELIHPFPDVHRELTIRNNTHHGDVFDPKLRQKLIDAQRLNKPRAQEKSNSWTNADGRTFIDMGDGNCLVTMPQVDSRDRGTNWGHTRCGKNDSEKAMDRVMANYESRKIQTKNHP